MSIKGLEPDTIDAMPEEQAKRLLRLLIRKHNELRRDYAKLEKQISDASWLDNKGNPTYQNGA